MMMNDGIRLGILRQLFDFLYSLLDSLPNRSPSGLTLFKEFSSAKK
jgi:hypothetical protein